MKETRIQYILTMALAFLAAFVLAANAQDVAKNDAKTPPKAEKPDPMALTPEEGALLRPIFDDFNKWNQKLNAASELLDKSEDAASPEIEGLQLQLAAKDIRAARKEIRRLRVRYAEWEAEGKKKRACEDCRFDETIGKFIKVSK